MKHKHKLFKHVLSSVLSLAAVVCFAFGVHMTSYSTKADAPAAKQWELETGAKTEGLPNGNYLLTNPAGGGVRVATTGTVDFGSFEMSFDMTNAPDTTGANLELLLGFMSGQNKYFTEDAAGAYFMVALRKTSATSLTVCLFDSWGNFANNVTYGQVDLNLTESKVVDLKIEKTETNVVFNLNDQKIEKPVGDFYGEGRKFFTDAAYNGSRYLVLGSMGAYTIEISPFKDKTFGQAADAIKAAVKAYEDAANALTEQSTMDDVNAAKALKTAINLESDALTAEEKAALTARIQTADGLVEAQRVRIVVANTIASVDAYVNAANALTNECTLDDVAAANALKDAINLDIPEITEEVETAQLARIAAADVLVEIQRLRLENEAEGNPVVGDTSMTPWTYHIGTNAWLLRDGSYRLQINDSEGGTTGFGVRAAYGYEVDFGTFETTFDFTETVTGSYPDWLVLTFAKGYNIYMNDTDTGCFVVAFERHKQSGDDAMRVLLYKHYLTTPMTDSTGTAYEVSFTLPASQLLNFKIEKTADSVIFHCNEATMTVPASYFYGDDRVVFNSEGDVFDGKRFVTFGTQRSSTDMFVGVSEFKDAETLAYNASVKPLFDAVDAYVAAASALTNSSVAADVLAAEALRKSCKLTGSNVRDYTRNFLARKVAAADVLVARQRTRLAPELIGSDVENFEAAVEAISGKAMLADAEEALAKIDMDVVEALTDANWKAELISRITAAKADLQNKIDELVLDLIEDLEAKAADLTTTDKLAAAVEASLAIEPELFAKVSVTNTETYGARIVAARALLEEAKDFEKYELTNSIFASTTANGGMGVYATPAVLGDAPVVYLKDKVSAVNVNIDLTMSKMAGGFFAIQLMEKMESFRNESGTGVAGNIGIVVKISRASENSQSYDISLYVIRATASNGFEGCLYAKFSAPVLADGKISVVFIQDGNYVDLIVNGTKMISNRMTKTVVQGMFGAELKGYLSVFSAFAVGDSVSTYAYEINKINGKSVFAEDVAEPVIVEATEIKLNKTSAQLKVYENLLLTAVVSPDNTTNNSVAWTSSDEDILIVDETGYVTALAVGQATITATTSNGLTAVCTITVVDENGGGESSAPERSGCGKGCGSVAGGSVAMLVSMAAVSSLLLKKKKH